MSLDQFKIFVKDNPKLESYVRNGEMSWQKFYELYDLYGPSNDVWNKYLNVTTSGVSSFKDILGIFRNMDMNEIQKGIGSIQKGIGYVQEFLSSRTNNQRETKKEEYEPRPIYKYFDD